MLKRIRELVSLLKFLAVCERFQTDVVIIGVVFFVKFVMTEFSVHLLRCHECCNRSCCL